MILNPGFTLNAVATRTQHWHPSRFVIVTLGFLLVAGIAIYFGVSAHATHSYIAHNIPTSIGVAPAAKVNAQPTTPVDTLGFLTVMFGGVSALAAVGSVIVAVVALRKKVTVAA